MYQNYTNEVIMFHTLNRRHLQGKTDKVSALKVVIHSICQYSIKSQVVHMLSLVGEIKKLDQNQTE